VVAQGVSTNVGPPIGFPLGCYPMGVLPGVFPKWDRQGSRMDGLPEQAPQRGSPKGCPTRGAPRVSPNCVKSDPTWAVPPLEAHREFPERGFPMWVSQGWSAKGSQRGVP
jgi:hypothetical protein